MFLLFSPHYGIDDNIQENVTHEQGGKSFNIKSNKTNLKEITELTESENTNNCILINMGDSDLLKNADSVWASDDPEAAFEYMFNHFNVDTKTRQFEGFTKEANIIIASIIYSSLGDYAKRGTKLGTTMGQNAINQFI
jgi:hypothetical protein